MITVMDLQLIFFLLPFLHGIYGEVNVPLSTAVARGEDVSLVCTSTETNPTFTWTYVTAGQSLYTGTTRATSVPRYDNIVLRVGTDAQTSILDISAIVIEDEGEYLCSTVATTTPPPNTEVTVEVGSDPKDIDLNSVDNFANYTATCDALRSKPRETITWFLDGVMQTDGIVETDSDISAPLLDKRSVFTFPASLENYDVTLVCEISGHQASSIIPRQESRRVDVQNPPDPEGIMIDFNSDGTDLTVSCNTNDAVAAAIPPMDSFYIYSNGTLLTGPSSDNSFTDTEPEQDTEFTCVGSNYLGSTNTTETFVPGGTTTPPPVTALETTTLEDTVGSNGSQTEVGGLSTGAVAGIAVGCILCVVIIVVIVLFLLKPECCPCFAGSGTPPPSNKPSGRAVGSSNGSGSEKEKLPQAAPRGHGSIQHTNDNPDQAMYAMVDKKPARGGGGGAGDAPDRGSGPGQNEPQGMLYADLDLSHKAGHTDKHVPKNENDVVVYSSILV